MSAADAADGRFLAGAHRILADLVASGAAIGWVQPPSADEVTAMLTGVLTAAGNGDAAIRAAYSDGTLTGLGYWTRYERPTHRVNADLQKIAVARSAQGTGIGRLLVTALVDDARAAGIETLTLDCRADNEPALKLYRSLGFTEYGRLERFVCFGDQRYDKVFCALDLRDTQEATGRE